MQVLQMESLYLEKPAQPLLQQEGEEKGNSVVASGRPMDLGSQISSENKTSSERSESKPSTEKPERISKGVRCRLRTCVCSPRNRLFREES